jgi:hypothetical protein
MGAGYAHEWRRAMKLLAKPPDRIVSLSCKQFPA